MREHVRPSRRDYRRDQRPNIDNVHRDNTEEEWKKRLEGESNLDYSQSENNPRHKRQHCKNRAHHQRLHIQSLRKRHRPPSIPVLNPRQHVPPRPPNPLLEQAATPGRHLCPTLPRRQSRSNVSSSKTHRQLSILDQGFWIPQPNPLQRRPPEERVRARKRNEQSQSMLSIIRQAIQEILVRRQPRNNALPKIQRPMKTMHSPSLRTIEIAESLLHSLLLRHIIGIKSRNDLARRPVKRKVQGITLPETRIPMEHFDPGILRRDRKSTRLNSSHSQISY